MMNQRMNVLHVISALPVGGVENQLCLVLKRYDRTRVTPIVCSLSDKGEVGREIEAAGIDVISLNKLGHGFDWTIVKDLMRLIRQRNVQVVRTHQYHANLYGRIAAWLRRVPCIVPSVHNVYTRDRKVHRRALNQLLGRLSDRVVAVSETVKKDIIKYDNLPEEKVIVIYNGIDRQRFLNIDANRVRSELGISSEAFVMGTVGRLTPQKGHKYLLDAISRAVKTFPHVVLLLVGGGPAKEDLMRYAEDLGITERVIFTDFRKDVPRMLAAMDAFVFPSLWEGLPNALIEAMAAGKPIIASDILSNVEVLESGKYGILVPAGDSVAIEAAMGTLLQNMEAAETLGNAARERALTCFDIDSTMDRYTNLFEIILAGKAKRPKGTEE